MSKLPEEIRLTLDVDYRDDKCFAPISFEGHLRVASVVVRMDYDEEDSPHLVEFAKELVRRYNDFEEYHEGKKK